MNIDEAIKHCKDITESNCNKCGAEHMQLAKWLERLKAYEKTGLEPEDILSNIKTLSNELNNVFEELQEYQKLEEQGLLIKLPCKLGTKLFVIQTELRADGKSTRREKRIVESEFTDWNILYVVDDWGKTVFLTREEAEKALLNQKL